MAEESVLRNTVCLALYLECQRNYSAFVIQWRNHNRTLETAPSRRYMARLLQKFLKTGSVHKISPPGRPKSQRSEQNINMVAEHFAINPSDSPQNFAKESKLCSSSTVRRILKMDVGWKPFKAKLVHKLDNLDHEIRYHFCKEMLKRINDEPDILSRIIFFDEIYIKLNGHVCTHNLRFWTDRQPNMLVERKSNCHGLMILIGISTRGSLLYFFDAIDIPPKYAKLPSKCKIKRKKVKITYGSMPCNSETFLFLLQKKIVNDVDSLFPDINRSDIVPVFDGASIHRQEKVVKFLNDTFSTNWIGNNSSNLKWPPRSPGRTFISYLKHQ